MAADDIDAGIASVLSEDALSSANALLRNAAPAAAQTIVSIAAASENEARRADAAKFILSWLKADAKKIEPPTEESPVDRILRASQEPNGKKK